MENKKFKKKFIGGFDKDEVIEYIDNLQKEQIQKPNEDKYLDEIAQLKNERDVLAAELEKANEQIRKLSDPLTGSNSMIASSISHSKSHFESMVSLSEEVRSETADNLSKLSGDVRKMLESALETRKNFEASTEKLTSDLEELKSLLERSASFFRDDRESLGDIRRQAGAKDDSIKQVLEEGYKLLDEATAQQSKIDKILKDLK